MEEKEEEQMHVVSNISREYTWNRSLQERDIKLDQFQVKLTKGLKLMPLGVRMIKYVAKVRKEGKEPYMDPFIDETIKSNTGIPCGGLGSGSIMRSWKGEFNHFFINPGRPQKDSVKGDQFSIYIKREGISPKAFVLGCPYKGDLSVEDGILEMPTVEPLPQDVESFLSTVPDDDEHKTIALEESNSNLSMSDEISLSESNGLSNGSNDSSLSDVSLNELMNENNNNNSVNITQLPKGKKKSQSGLFQRRSHTKTKSLSKKTTFITPSKALGEWNWKDVPGEYRALFPRAWTDYDLSSVDKKLKVTCKQISPVIPQNYRESSFPVTVFVWEIENSHPTKSVDVSLMFTFQNGVGRGSDYTGGHYNQPFDCNSSNFEELKTVGIEMVHRNRKKVNIPDSKQKDIYEDPLSFGIATIQPELSDPTNSHLNQMDATVTFETTGNGKDLWKSFSTTGRAVLYPPYGKSHSEKGIGIGSALSNYVHLEPNSTAIVVFSLAWDQPIVRFGSGRGFYSRYTRFYGIDGHAVQNICRDALLSWKIWDKMIDEWQMPILNNPDLPNEYKCALFNELYFLVAGGSIWVDREEHPNDRDHYKVKGDHTSAPKSTKRHDREKATKILEDFITLTQKIKNGMMVCDGALQNSGRIIFSLNELQEDKIYFTFNGNSIVRHSTGEVLLDTIILRSPSRNDIDSSNSYLNNTNDEDEDNNNNNEDLDEDNNHSSCENEKITIQYNENKNEKISNNDNDNDDDNNNNAKKKNEKFVAKKHYSPVISNDYGQFIYLEGQEYLMYNTYDVHFYASFALALLWPQLELNIQRDIARCAYIHSPNDIIYTLHSGEFKPRKLRGAIPHDIGTPADDPFYLINSYNIHDVNNWKDLNSKFTLQVFRDYVITNDLNFLKEMWPAVWECMHFLERYDQNRDGMIENSGFPDQTYDAWSVEGTSAYCGSLWVASLSATVEMAKILSLPEEVDYFQSLLIKASEVYEKKLWNGEFYKYDDSGNRDDIIMSDQLVGEWYARSSFLERLFPVDHIQSSLKCIYNHNFKLFHDGEMGVVNGFNSKTKQTDYSALQSSEVWTGTCYALIATMFQEGLYAEGWEIFQSLYRCIYSKFGYWFQTPEAWDEKGRYRSYAYMRPLSIWAIHWSLMNADKLNQSEEKDRDLLRQIIEQRSKELPSIPTSSSTNRDQTTNTTIEPESDVIQDFGDQNNDGDQNNGGDQVQDNVGY